MSTTPRPTPMHRAARATIAVTSVVLAVALLALAVGSHIADAFGPPDTPPPGWRFHAFTFTGFADQPPAPVFGDPAQPLKPAITAADGEGTPASWHTCEIHYRVNPANAPNGLNWLDVLSEQTKTLTSISGLNWVYDGTTSASQADGSWRADRNDQVLVEFRTPPADQVSATETTWGQPYPRGGPNYQAGLLLVPPTNGGNPWTDQSFADKVSRSLARVMGLGSTRAADPVDAPEQHMGGAPLPWGSGDIAGIRQLGPVGGLLTRRLAHAPKPAVTSDVDGRLEVFAETWDHIIEINYQQWPGGGWSNWGQFADGTCRSAPSVGRNSDGRLEMFSIGDDHRVWHTWQVFAGGWWSGWGPIDGAWFPTGSRVAVAIDHAGHLQLLGVDIGGVVQRSAQTPGGAWSPWTGDGAPLPATGQVDMAAGPGGVVAAVTSTSTGTVQLRTESDNGGWSAWKNVGGSVAATTNPGVAYNADSRLELFATSPAGVLTHAWEGSPGGVLSAWSPFAALPAKAGSPTVLPDRFGRLQLFVADERGSGYYASQVAANMWWTNWSQILPTQMLVGTGSIGINPDGRVEVFFQTTNTEISHAWQETPGGAWSPPAIVN